MINWRKLRSLKMNLMWLLVALQISSCMGQLKERSATELPEDAISSLLAQPIQRAVFPQIHTNLNGMVGEFVRAMHQDRKGNFWFGTNTNGIVRFDGQSLERVALAQRSQSVSVRKIVEDKVGNVWLGTSSRLVKYDGEKFTTFSTELGLQDEEIWGLTVDASGLVWVGTLGGVSRFDGNRFQPFLLPDMVVEKPQHMLSDKLVTNLIEDSHGVMWLVTDGNGIFKYHQEANLVQHLARYQPV